MRNIMIATGVALLGLGMSACDAGVTDSPEAPVLHVTSPQRSLVQSGAGQLTVTGTVAPNSLGTAVEKVLVNDVQASLDATGNFSAIVTVQPGATLIRTVARDAGGGEASDVRSVQAGELRTAGARIDGALAAALSTDSFAKISTAASGIIMGMDIGAMVAPLNPMVHKGDESGEDCLFARLWIDDVNFSGIKIALIPTDGGIQFRAEITGLDVPGHTRYAAACVNGSNTLRVKATKVIVGGTLLVSPKASGGFATQLDAPNVQITGLDIQASGIPGTIMDMLDVGHTIQGVVAKGAELAMEPMMNQALGGLAGPKTLTVLGHEMTMEVNPSDIVFDASGGLVALDASMLIKGAEQAKFIYTPNGTPSLDMTAGMQIGIADDFANEMMAQGTALGLFAITQPATGGTFDTTEVALTVPPMISADPADGKLKLILGDAIATFKSNGVTVGQAAINAKLSIKVATAEGNGFGVAVELDSPQVDVTVLDTVENNTNMDPRDLAKAVDACLTTQINAMSQLLRTVPLPAVAGLQMKNVSVGSDNGYVVLKGQLN